MTYLSPHRVRTKIREEHGLQVSKEALDMLESHVAGVVEETVDVTIGAGGRRITATTLRRALGNEK